MFGRFFLLFLSIVSLAWIVFIGYDLLDQKDIVSPQRVFDKKDGEILIVNRSSEVLLEELTFAIPKKITPLFKQLLKSVFPNERIYISEKRPIIIIESPKIWTKKAVQDYFDLKGVSISESSSNDFTLGNGLKGTFKKNHILISSLTELEPHKEKEWPLWDNKASASIVHLKKPFKSTNIYFKTNGSISYQTKYGLVLNCQKVDDEDLFSQFIPADIENYHFLEKEFAFKTNYLKKESPLYQWMERGFVEFNCQNTACLLSDYDKVIDPVSLLVINDQSVNNQDLGNKFSGIQLTKNFPKNSAKGFYIGRVADKVILSEKKEVLEKIIADYQLGNTLALNLEKSNEIFARMPKKVSERNATFDKSYSLSSYKNLLIKTYLYSNKNQIHHPQNIGVENKNNSFPFSGETGTFLGNGRVVFCITNQNEIIAISNKKQIWKQKLEGQIIGKAKLIDLNETGELQILINTSEKLYLFNTQGSTINEFPLSVKSSNEASFYRWNSKANFLLVNTNNELVQIDQNGHILKKLKLNVSNVKNEVSVFKNEKMLSALVTGDQKTQLIDLIRFKNTKNSMYLPKERLQIISINGFYYFEKTSSGIVRYDQTGKQSVIYSGKAIKNLKKIYRGKQTLICFQDNNMVFVINESGMISQKFVIDINEIENFDLIMTKNGNTYLAVIDEIENNVFIFDALGKRLNEKPFEGKKEVKLSDENGKLTITTLIENYIVQYYDVLEK